MNTFNSLSYARGISCGTLSLGQGSDNIVIGSKSDCKGSNSIVIGTNVIGNDNSIAIGNTQNQVTIGTINVTSLLERVDSLEKLINKLEKVVKDQQETIEALWYHPGMPGYQ